MFDTSLSTSYTEDYELKYQVYGSASVTGYNAYDVAGIDGTNKISNFSFFAVEEQYGF